MPSDTFKAHFPAGLPLTDGALSAIDYVARLVIIVMMTVMVSVVSAQVFARYLLSSSIGWADEISRLTFVWSVFLAIPLGTRARAHIGIELITSRLPEQPRAALARVVALIATLLMVLVAYQSAKIAIEQWDELMASIDFSAGWFILPVAIGMTHTALHLLRIMIFGPYEAKPAIMATE